MKWEYQVRVFRSDLLSSLERDLLAAGNDGRELVCTIPSFLGLPPPLPPSSLAIFKRPVSGGDGAQVDTVTVTVRLGRDGKPAASAPA